MLVRVLASSTLAFLIVHTAHADTFRLSSKASGQCIRLQDANQNDGGGLTIKECKNFPDFFVTGTTSITQLIFMLNSSKAVCVFATEQPDIDGPREKVGTRNCAGVVGSSWTIRGEDADGFRQVEKLNGINSTNFCLTENAQTSELELDVCQSVPEQHWKMQRIVLPPEG